MPESSLNQISKLATVSSSFPRIDPSGVIERKREMLNGRLPVPAKGDFAARPRSNKTGDMDTHRTGPNGEAERKSNHEKDISHESPSFPMERNIDKSIENNQGRGIQHDDMRNISSNSESRLIPTRVIKSESSNEKSTRLDQRDVSVKDSFPSSVLNSRFPDEDLTSRNPNSANSRDLPLNNNNGNRGFDDRDDSERGNDKSKDDKMSKGDVRIMPDPQPPTRDGIRLRDRDHDKDIRYSDSDTRRRGDVDRYDDREDRYRDRLPYDDRHTQDRKKEDDKYMPASTRNSRNRDRIVDEDRFADDRRDRRRGDEERYDGKPSEDRYRDRILTDQKYSDRREEDIDRYNNRDGRLSRDRSRVSSDDEYFEKYPGEDRKNREDFPDRPIRQNRYQKGRLPENDRRSVLYHDEQRNKDPAERSDEIYPKENRNNDKIPEYRYRDESRRRYDDEYYDRRERTEEEEYRYRDRYRDDRDQPYRSRSRTDDRYNYRGENVDSSRYDPKEDNYRDYSKDENSRPESRATRRDSLMSSRADYRPPPEERVMKESGSTRNDRRYLSSSSRPYMEGDISDSKKDVGFDDRDRGIFKDEGSDKFPQLDRRDRISPTRVKEDRRITREPDEDSYYPIERRIDGSYPDSRRPTMAETKYHSNDDRSGRPTDTRIESSRVLSSGRREYYPTEEIENPPKSRKDEVSLERRSYSSEDDKYRLNNANTRSRTNKPDITSYDDRRHDYGSDDPNKEGVTEERSRRTNVRNRDAILRDDGVGYDRDGNKDDQYRDASDGDKYYRDRDGPTDRSERNRDRDRYNRNRDRFDDRKYEDDKYDRNRDKYDDRYEEDRRVRNRDRYDYRSVDDRYDRSRDRYDEDRYDRNRDRYDRNRDRYGDDAEYETGGLDRNSGKRDDERYREDRYDKPSEQKPRDASSTQEDRIRPRDTAETRLRNISPSRSHEQREDFPPSLDAAKTPFYSDLDDRGVDLKDTRLRESPVSDYEANRPLSAKDVIDAALRQSESTELGPKKVFYPVFDPRISNLTSSDIIRPSERRGSTINSRRRRKRAFHFN